MINEDEGALFDVLNGDSDPDIGAAGDVLTITQVTAIDPLAGQVSISDNKILYETTPDYSGAFDFYYTISDIAGETDTAKVTVNVSDTQRLTPSLSA